MADRIYIHGFAFDSDGGVLRDGERVLTLRPKAAAVLARLVARAGEVVTKRDLLELVWPDTYVTEAALAVCVNELRRAFGDDPRRPRLIATVHGRGYRLIAEVASTPPARPQEAPPFVGRAGELAELRGWLQRAERGQRVLGFVAAPAGVGKTALLDAFLAGLQPSAERLVAWAQCAEHLDEGEPYRPLLDALAGLCRGPGGQGVHDVLARAAPTWLLQMPALLDAAEADALSGRGGGASAERMVRELGDAIEMLTSTRTLVLIIEDLHAGDRATAELIGYLAGRRGPARLLLLGSYRPAEAIARSHPFREVVQDLRSRRRCGHLALELLSPVEVAEYLSVRLAPRDPSPALAADIHERTDGHALFLVAVTDFLVERGLLREAPDGVVTPGRLAQLGMPREVRQMLERSIDLLDARDQRLLAVAAAAGLEFSAEAVRAGLDSETDSTAEVEERCARIAREHPVLVAAGESEWPDGTLSGRFRFGHSMYRDLLYGRLGPARRANVHRAIGRRMAAGWMERSQEVAPELAMHLERGREYGLAVHHLSVGAETALARSAYPEVLEHVERGLGLLGRLPEAERRPEVEAVLCRCEIVARGAVWGWRDERARARCLRLRELAAATGDTAAGMAALLGLHNHAQAVGDAEVLRSTRREIDELSARTGDTGALLVAHFLHMQADSRAGRCSPAWQRSQAMLRLYRGPEHQQLTLLVGEQLDVAAELYSGMELWMLGHPDRARHHIGRGLTAAREHGIPAGLARSLWWTAVVHLLCGDEARLADALADLDAVCRRHRIRLWAAGGVVMGGSLLAMRGEVAAGLAQIRRGDAAWRRIIPVANSFHVRLEAEQCLAAGEREAGLAVVSAGLDALRPAGHGQGETELLRLRGELLLLGGAASAEQAERDMRAAMLLAREREARGFELRAVTSLAGLLTRTDRAEEARDLLAGLLDWFSEGGDTADVRRARSLLASIDGGVTLEGDP